MDGECWHSFKGEQDAYIVFLELGILFDGLYKMIWGCLNLSEVLSCSPGFRGP
jgi:hypothetical protein